VDAVPTPGLDPETGSIYVPFGVERALLYFSVGDPRRVPCAGVVGLVGVGARGLRLAGEGQQAGSQEAGAKDEQDDQKDQATRCPECPSFVALCSLAFFLPASHRFGLGSCLVISCLLLLFFHSVQHIRSLAVMSSTARPYWSSFFGPTPLTACSSSAVCGRAAAMRFSVASGRRRRPSALLLRGLQSPGTQPFKEVRVVLLNGWQGWRGRRLHRWCT